MTSRSGSECAGKAGIALRCGPQWKPCRGTLSSLLLVRAPTPAVYDRLRRRYYAQSCIPAASGGPRSTAGLTLGSALYLPNLSLIVKAVSQPGVNGQIDETPCTVAKPPWMACCNVTYLPLCSPTRCRIVIKIRRAAPCMPTASLSASICLGPPTAFVSRQVQEIICFSDSEPHGENASWQFQISQDPMSYILVNLGKGQGSAMSSFLSPDTGLTQPGMAELNASDPRQHWDWQTMDPTKGYTVQNVANGTNWLLDVHNITSGTLSMSPSASLSQERWIVSSAAPISNAPAPACCLLDMVSNIPPPSPDQPRNSRNNKSRRC
ncbi:hypothetical protein FH972_021376 [Carpinus fangiana]|uniref:Ricin B lectin domain-containing protein n=1 Tax=Carpinus fangiana TaxID=176857 RepID=A0A5N6KP61_9ROSI|nr:hypothetical protein FH972_021376 [Carpinus fangiana]